MLEKLIKALTIFKNKDAELDTWSDRFEIHTEDQLTKKEEKILKQCGFQTNDCGYYWITFDE